MRYLILAAAILSGCGSISPVLQQGRGIYGDESHSNNMSNRRQLFSVSAYGCFHNGDVDSEIIKPAVDKYLIENKAISAVNVRAERSMAPTIADALTGGFIWGCSYWDVTGDAIF